MRWLNWLRWLMDYIVDLATKTRYLMQETRATNANRIAGEKEVISELKMIRFDDEVSRIDETLDRLRDRGALIE